MNDMTPIEKTTPKEWETDQEVRWCPGCGDYAILKAVQRTMPEIGARPEKTVFVSGIGCSSRFPYYMETYGFHTIHGRAPAIATGVKLANPELDVWIITGDGDALSIGGNHTMHLLRRNLNCQVLLFNNEIYGLTKGQYSPTSRVGTRSPSTPFGSGDRPARPCAFALGSGARFVARGIDVHKNLPMVLKAAHQHQGAAVAVHDQTNRGLAHMLVEMPFGEFPMALGVLYDDPAPTFDSAVVAQNKAAAEGKKPELQKLLSQGQTWMVEKQPHVI